MFLKSAQFIKIFILAMPSTHMVLHAMEAACINVSPLYKVDPGFIWVSDSLSGEPVRMPAEVFAQKHGFKWTEGLVYDSADVVSELKCDSGIDNGEMPVSARNWVFSEIARNKEKLVLRYINDAVGWGLFAREDITPDPNAGYTYVALYGGLLKAFSPKHPREEHGGRYSLEMLKGETGYASINAEKYRNFGPFIQHAPKSLENYIFDPSFKSEVAIENLQKVSRVCASFPYLLFQAPKAITKGTLLCWDYGTAHWDSFQEIPHLFTTKGEMIDRSSYKLKEIIINVILDKEILELLSPRLKYGLQCDVLLKNLDEVQDFFLLPLAENFDGENDVMVKVFANDILQGYQKCPQNVNLNVPGTLSLEIGRWDKQYLKKVQDAIHHNLALCQHCGEKSQKPQNLLSCSQCKAVFYCDKLCQKNNWPAHKAICKKAI